MSGIVYKKNGFSTPFLRGYRELRIPIVDSAGTPAWPELFPTTRIENLRETVGPRHFSSQMMLNYVSPDRARLDPDAIHLYTDEFDVRAARIGSFEITGLTLYWDPSMGRKHSDGSVCVLLYRDDKSRHIFVHDVLYLGVEDDELHPLARQCEQVLAFMTRVCVRRIYIETNGIGNALPEIMRDCASRQHINICIQKIINTKNKEFRILDTIEPVLTTGRLHMHMRVQSTPLLAEMLGWSPIGGVGHDDGLDAVAGAICATPIAVRPAVGRGQTFSAKTDFEI